ncbi:hypothetical protein [Luteimonas saliphila]|nr:hypothetical protein [Luteimonas saliphila]
MGGSTAPAARADSRQVRLPALTGIGFTPVFVCAPSAFGTFHP